MTGVPAVLSMGGRSWVRLRPGDEHEASWVRLDQIQAISTLSSVVLEEVGSNLPTLVSMLNGRSFWSCYSQDELMALLKEHNL